VCSSRLIYIYIYIYIYVFIPLVASFLALLVVLSSAGPVVLLGPLGPLGPLCSLGPFGPLLPLDASFLALLVVLLAAGLRHLVPGAELFVLSSPWGPLAHWAQRPKGGNLR